MFGMSAERSEAQRPPRIDSGGTPPLRSLCTRKETLKAAIVTKATGNITESLGQAFLKACGFQRQSLWSPSADGEILLTKSLRKG